MRGVHRMKKRLMLVIAMLVMLSMAGSNLVYASNDFGQDDQPFELEYYVRIDPVSGVASVVYMCVMLEEPIVIDNPMTGVTR